MAGTMADGEIQSVLRRKAEIGRRSGPDARRPDACKVLAGAVARATDEVLGLVASVKVCTPHRWTLAELLEGIPDDGLLAVLEGPMEGQGLMALDATLLASVIEKQMTGRLASEPPVPRRPTRTDAALSADVIDGILRALEADFEGRPELRWVAGFGFSTYFSDARPLGLLLEEIEYRVFALTIDLEGGQREGCAVLALPAEGRGPVVETVAPVGVDEPVTSPEGWSRALEDAVRDGEVPVEAVLWRMRMTIAEVASLQVGQELVIPVASIDRAVLCAIDGTPVIRGRLGQSRGQRALRLSIGAAGGSDTDAAAQFGSADLRRGGGIGDGGLDGAEGGDFAAGPPPLPRTALPQQQAPEEDLSDLSGFASDDDGPPALDLDDLADLPDLA